MRKDAKLKLRRPCVSADYRVGFCNRRNRRGAKYRLKKRNPSTTLRREAAVGDVRLEVLDDPLADDLADVAAIDAIDADNERVLIVFRLGCYMSSEYSKPLPDNIQT